MTLKTNCLHKKEGYFQLIRDGNFGDFLILPPGYVEVTFFSIKGECFKQP
jgi:hypothetical protein